MRSFALLVLIGCAGPIAGRPVEHARNPPGPPVASASTSDPNGIRVLANTNAGRGDAGLLATNEEEYAALWADVGLGASSSRTRPAIDFATHVVLGTNFEGGVCQPELVAAHVDAAGVLTFEAAPLADVCILLAARTSLVVAVPRSILPAHFTWRTNTGDFALDLAPRAGIATRPAPAVDTGIRTAIAAPLGTVTLPAIGHIALRSLDNGREVWVARRNADDISVLLADRPSRTPGLNSIVTWNDETHRFSSGHDSRGRALDGGAPLDALAFARLSDERIAIGTPIQLAFAPPIARADEPALDGPARPYTAAAIPFQRAADKRWSVVEDSLVTGTAGVAQLCILPDGKARQFLDGCLRSHPRVTSIATRRPRVRSISMTHGPLAILRDGKNAALVINLGSGESGWVVEHSLEAPADRGPSPMRGALPVGITVTGSTTKNHNSDDPPASCVPIVGRGSPDESWTFTAPRTGTYVFELESTYDGVITLYDARPTAKLYTSLACNDDANGYYRRSAFRVELAAYTKTTLVVDGFGGARGTYKLTVREQPALPRLEVGSSITADTTNAVDLESHGCYAPAGDHRIPLTIREAGRYVFRIDTPGWAPMISVFEAGGSEFGCYTHLPPLIDSHLMKSGEYFVVVDGSDKKQHGTYTLSVSRCASDDEKSCEASARTPPTSASTL